MNKYFLTKNKVLMEEKRKDGYISVTLNIADITGRKKGTWYIDTRSFGLNNIIELGRFSAFITNNKMGIIVYV